LKYQGVPAVFVFRASVWASVVPVFRNTLESPERGHDRSCAHQSSDEEAAAVFIAASKDCTIRSSSSSIIGRELLHQLYMFSSAFFACLSEAPAFGV